LYYSRTGFYKESLEYYDNAISLSEKENLKDLIPDIYFYKSGVYSTLNDITGQRECLKHMIDAGLANKNYWPVIVGYYYYGTSFCGDSLNVPARNFQSADSLLKKCIFYARLKNDTSILAGALANSGWNFYLAEKYDSAVYYYKRSLKYSLPGKRNYTTVNSYGNLGTIYRDLHMDTKAIDFYNMAIKEAKNDINSNTRNLWWIYRDMSSLYLGLGDTARAYETFTLYKKYDDLNKDQLSKKGLSDARVRYEADSHRKEVELLSLRLKNNRILNFGFLGFIILLIAIGILVLRGYRLRNKRRISEMNRKIAEVTQANLRQQMNPHFIFNTLNSIQYYMYQHDKLATNNYLTKFSTLMRKVLDNSRHTSVPLSDELGALRLYLELECIRFKDKFDFKITVDEEIDPLMYKVPTMLIQPYVENSITHGLMPLEGKGFVHIDIRMNDSCLLCTIEDNGIGRKAARERSRVKDTNHNSLGTQITESRLDLVNSLYGTNLKTNCTDLADEQGEPSGTRVEIHIPIIS
jgi:tetratricopeptide (TPR) repeat protein